jgi:hypothetical protein
MKHTTLLLVPICNVLCRVCPNAGDYINLACTHQIYGGSTKAGIIKDTGIGCDGMSPTPLDLLSAAPCCRRRCIWQTHTGSTHSVHH